MQLQIEDSSQRILEIGLDGKTALRELMELSVYKMADCR